MVAAAAEVVPTARLQSRHWPRTASRSHLAAAILPRNPTLTYQISSAATDGVPLLSARLDGPLEARLEFDVGSEDEPVHLHGITHIVEHLTLAGLGAQPYAYNGEVSPTGTTFVALGSEEQVQAFLTHVCRTLGELPLDRMTDELRILRVEASRRELNQIQADLITRFGAMGPAISGWREYGLHSATPDAVQSWAHRWFTRSNAVLTLTGDVPEGLALPLPKGPAREPRSLPPDRVTGRRWGPRKTKLVSVSVVRVSADLPAGMLGIQAARERALAALRSQSAVSYSVSAVQLGIGNERVLCQLAADADAAAYWEVLSTLSSSLTGVCREGPSEAELAFLTERGGLAAEDRRSAPGMLALNANRVRKNLPVIQVGEFIELQRSVRPEDVVRILSPSLELVLALGPSLLGGALPGWQEISEWSPTTISGQEFRAVPGQDTGELVIGPEGVMWRRHRRAFRTIRWQDAAAVLCWENGARRVVGADGVTVFVAPWGFNGGAAMTSLVDRYTDPERRVALDVADAPKPRPVPPRTAPARPGLRRQWQAMWRRPAFRRHVVLYALFLLPVIAFAIATNSVYLPILWLVSIAIWLMRLGTAQSRSAAQGPPGTA